MGFGWVRMQRNWVLDGAVFRCRTMQRGWGKEFLRNRTLGGKNLLSIAVKGARFAVVNTRHVPHMFCDLGHLYLPV